MQQVHSQSPMTRVDAESGTRLSGLGGGPGIEHKTRVDGELPNGQRVQVELHLRPGPDAPIAVSPDAGLLETLTEGPVRVALADRELTFERRGEMMLATAQAGAGEALQLRGVALPDGRIEFAPSLVVQADTDEPAGAESSNSVLEFFAGAGREVSDQLTGIWNMASRTAETITQATLAPLEWAAGATAGAVSSLWREGGPGELSQQAWEREIEATREAWADIGATAENFFMLVYHLGPGQVPSYAQSLTELTTALQARALGEDGISRNELGEMIARSLDGNPSFEAKAAILDALTNYRDVVRAATGESDESLAAELGRSTVRILDLLAGVVARKVSRAPEIAHAHHAGRLDLSDVNPTNSRSNCQQCALDVHNNYLRSSGEAPLKDIRFAIRRQEPIASFGPDELNKADDYLRNLEADQDVFVRIGKPSDPTARNPKSAEHVLNASGTHGVVDGQLNVQAEDISSYLASDAFKDAYGGLREGEVVEFFSPSPSR